VTVRDLHHSVNNQNTRQVPYRETARNHGELFAKISLGLPKDQSAWQKAAGKLPLAVSLMAWNE
jgi:hypothetical protein